MPLFRERRFFQPAVRIGHLGTVEKIHGFCSPGPGYVPCQRTERTSEEPAPNAVHETHQLLEFPNAHFSEILKEFDSGLGLGKLWMDTC